MTHSGHLEEPAELEPEQGSLDLADPADAWSVADWEQAAAAVLRKVRRLGEDDPAEQVWQKLTRTTLDGIGVTPLGTPASLDALVTRGRPTRAGEWDVRSHVDASRAGAANEEARVDLDGGVTSLWLRVAPGDDLATVLQGVLLDLAPVVLDATDAPLDVARAFLSCAGDSELHAGTNLGVSGEAREEDVLAVAGLAREAGVLGVVVDATAAHDRGASDAQELAHSLLVGARVLRLLTGSGWSVEEAARLVEFRYAATDEQLATIAKLRAARRLWARVLELSDASSQETHGWAQRQHVVTSRPMMSKYDPWVNMLRTTVAAFAAGVGGADAVTVLPFDTPLGVPDAFGRRIARNTSALLISESHVARVADPAGGAYAVEKLTDDLARAGWELFGRLEDAPDPGATLDEAVAEVVSRRERDVATRTRPITGLTEFPHLAEVLPERVSTSSASAGAEVRRWGASFEALRDDPPQRHVFLATLGPVATHTARATFATNLLAAGGIAVDVAGATKDADELVAAYDGQPVVCLAGSDPTYADWGEQAAAALREAGARHVIIAGRPTGYAEDSCATGVDALDFLTRTRSKL